MRKGADKVSELSDGRLPPSILVVENEARISCGIQSSLIRLGYDVPATAASPAEALKAVEVHRPDLIVMDVRLEEGTDGIAAAAAIRARHPTPIVFLTAHSDDATLNRAQEEAQPYGYLLKPYKDSELRAAIEIALKRHRLVCGAVEVGCDVTVPRGVRSELQLQSETDALTGVYNRRGFMQVARTAFDMARKSGRQPAVFFIDLNGMKPTNDSLGHPEGDRLLMDLAWILRACFRTSDILGRLGGDEFVALAPDAGGHADALRERLRAAVDRFNEGSDRSYRISVSIGLSTSGPGQPESPEDLVEQAHKRGPTACMPLRGQRPSRLRAPSIPVHG